MTGDAKAVARQHEMAQIPSAASLEEAAAWLTLQRVIFIDVPLIWAMELSRFISRQLDAQIRHGAALAGCCDLTGAIEEQVRFARESVSELGEEVQALTRETQTALAA